MWQMHTAWYVLQECSLQSPCRTWRIRFSDHLVYTAIQRTWVIKISVYKFKSMNIHGENQNFVQDSILMLMVYNNCYFLAGKKLGYKNNCFTAPLFQSWPRRSSSPEVHRWTQCSPSHLQQPSQQSDHRQSNNINCY